MNINTFLHQLEVKLIRNRRTKCLQYVINGNIGFAGSDVFSVNSKIVADAQQILYEICGSTRRILEMHQRAKKVKSIARRFEKFLPYLSPTGLTSLAESSNVRYMETPGLRRTRRIDCTILQSIKRARKKNSGRKDEKPRKRKGDRGREKKWEHCEASAFDKSSF